MQRNHIRNRNAGTNIAGAPDAIGEGRRPCGTICLTGAMRLDGLVACGAGVVMQAFAWCTIMRS